MLRWPCVEATIAGWRKPAKKAKVVSDGPPQDKAFRERFLRESRLAASLDHPNVIPIYDADEAEVRSAMAALHTRLLSVPVSSDGDEVDSLWELWVAVGGDEEPQAAWEAIVTALIRHPGTVIY